MKYEIIEDAPILIPNKEHRNFTHGKDMFPQGTIVDGELILIKGLRKGEDFEYRILRTNEGELIYINKTKPMKNVEVTLGADGNTTVVKMPNETNMTIIIASATAVGALGGFMFARKKKYETKKQILAVAIGGILGYIAGRLIEKNKSVLIQKR